MRSSAHVFVVIGTSVVAGCSDPAAIVSDLTQTQTTDHYIFHMAEGDSVDTVWQESYYGWITAELGIDSSPQLEYFKYRSRAHLAALTGRETNGFAEPGTVRFHTIWPLDNHEGVHTLVILHFGHAPALFNEGVAVAHQVNPASGDLEARWSGKSVHELARGFLEQGTLPALEALIESSGFFSHDEGVTYPGSGSFVRHLLDRYGVESLRDLLSGATFGDSAAVTRERFAAAYGLSLEDAWTSWQEWLETGNQASMWLSPSLPLPPP